MLLGETIAVAFQSIRANKLRAALTMLGIVIGVGAVITMVALGSGAQKAVKDRINSLGANLLNIYAGQMNVRGVASDQRVSLTVDDADALRRDASLISNVVPEISKQVQVKYGNQNINVNVVGHHGELRRRPQLHGDLRPDVHPGRGPEPGALRRARVRRCPEMLGANPAAMIGQTVSVRGIPFEIIGILSEKGSQGFQNPDEQILIPLQTARFRVFGTDRLRTITVEVAKGVPLEQGMVDMERVLRREHKIRPGGRQRLHGAEPARVPGHAAGGDPGLHRPAGLDRRGEPASWAASAS